MPFLNYGSKEIIYKIVYYGCGMCGKTSSVQFIHNMLSPSTRGELISLASEAERTLYFDYLPVDLGLADDFKLKLALYTVPGQPEYNHSRRHIMRNADALVFVVDSSSEASEDNAVSFSNMLENLESYGFQPTDVPWVIQYNKRDLVNALPIAKLETQLNQKYCVPYYESVAIDGRGVFACLKGATKLAVDKSGHRLSS